MFFVLLLSYLAPYLHPKYFSFISVVAVFSPVVIFINIALACYWIIRWDKMALYSILILVVGVNHIAKFIQVPVRKMNQSAKASNLKIITFNAHFFTTPSHKDVLIPTIDYIDSLNADIICFQEFASSSQHDRVNIVNKLLSKYTYRYISKVEIKSTGMEYYNAIYSKYRVVNRANLPFGNTLNQSMYADILYRGDTIRVFNNHLQTSNVTSSDIKFLSGDVDQIASENSLFRFFAIGKKLGINSIKRAEQSDILHELVSDTPHSVIICGDHNAIPLSYTYNRIRGDMEDAYLNKGKWYGYTYKSFARLLRIDYVFHSDKFETISYQSPNVLWSDHKPVIVELKYNK